jgi:hypothetical protein
MKKTFAVWLSSVFLLLTAGYASATSLSTSTVDGTTVVVDNLASWAATGNTMDGLSVTVNLVDSSGSSYSETLSWADDTGVVSTTYGWSLTMSDYEENTWYDDVYWSLTSSGDYSITSLVLDGIFGNTVFDTVFDPETTPDSKLGRSIAFIDNGSDLTVSAVYSNIVAVDNSDALGDLYSTLTLSFSHVDGSYFNNETFTFYLDTDNVNEVPEPSTILLFGAGLACLAGSTRKNKK